MFCDGFEFNSVRFNDYEKLMHDLCVTGKIHKAFFHPVARPVLHPTLRPVLHPALRLTLHPTLGAWASWRLLYWRPVLGESTTWVLFTLVASNY
jgi:hypothetical protein